MTKEKIEHASDLKSTILNNIRIIYIYIYIHVDIDM